MYEKLFEKGRIGNVELKNRLVMTPMVLILSAIPYPPWLVNSSLVNSFLF